MGKEGREKRAFIALCVQGGTETRYVNRKQRLIARIMQAHMQRFSWEGAVRGHGDISYPLPSQEDKVEVHSGHPHSFFYLQGIER